MTPLALSSDQLAVVADYAVRVPHEWRERFLSAIADRLVGLDVVGNDDVRRACAVALRRMGAPA
jgi:hypothetical protein